MKVDDAFVDAHLPAVPGVGTFTTGGFTDGKTEGLGGHADRAGVSQSLFLGALDELAAH